MRTLPFVATAALAACASKSEGDNHGTGGPPPAPVEVAEVRTGNFEVEWKLLGEVRSEAHAELAAGASGQVRRVTVREGDRAEQGTLLVEIDPSLARAQLEARSARRRQAREQREQAERDAERMAGAGRKAVAARQIEEARSRRVQLGARAEAAGAELQEARARLHRHRVAAPFSGEVAARTVDPGDWVNPGDPVLELVSVERVEVLVDAPAELVRHIHVGQAATLRQDERELAAQVVGLVRALDRQTRTAIVRLAPKDTPAWMMPGGTVDAVFRVVREEEGTVIVPRDALVTGAVGKRVVKTVDDEAKPVEVRVVASSAREAMVTAKALKPGDSVVIRGNERLRPGQPVTVAGES